MSAACEVCCCCWCCLLSLDEHERNINWLFTVAIFEFSSILLRYCFFFCGKDPRKKRESYLNPCLFWVISCYCTEGKKERNRQRNIDEMKTRIMYSVCIDAEAWINIFSKTSLFFSLRGARGKRTWNEKSQTEEENESSDEITFFFPLRRFYKLFCKQ